MIEDILDQCLSDIRARRASVADCLRKYPQYADELAPLLETALALEAAPNVQPTREFREKTRARVAKATQSPPRRFFFFAPARFSLATFIALVLVVLGLTGGTVYAANDSLPDSALYSIKRGAENVQLWLTNDQPARARLHMTFAERRLNEFIALNRKSGATTLADYDLNEYRNEIDAAVKSAIGGAGSASGALVQELSDRLAKNQMDLHSLQKVKDTPEHAIQNALDASQKAQDTLHGH